MSEEDIMLADLSMNYINPSEVMCNDGYINYLYHVYQCNVCKQFYRVEIDNWHGCGEFKEQLDGINTKPVICPCCHSLKKGFCNDVGKANVTDLEIVLKNIIDEAQKLKPSLDSKKDS